MRSRLTGVGVAILTSTVLVVPASVGLVAPASASEGPTATVEQLGTWPTGYLGQVTIHNPGTASVTGWRVEFDLPWGTEITSHWLAELDGAGGHHVFTNHGYNATVPAGGSQSFGFVAAGTGVPSGCLVNGAPCDGMPSPPPPSPTPMPPPPPPPAVPIPPPMPAPGERLIRPVTAAELQPALDAAVPGDLIWLHEFAPFEGEFRIIDRHGTAELPIRLVCGRCTLTGTGPSSGTGLEIVDSSHISVEGLMFIQNYRNGVVAEGVTSSRFQRLSIGDIGAEGLVLRESSSDNVVDRVGFDDLGLADPQRGHGIAVGSPSDQWPGGQPDASDRNEFIDNNFGFAGPGADILLHEGTSDGLIRGNSFLGSVAQPPPAGPWLDIRGNGYVVEGNRGRLNQDPQVLSNGFETHAMLSGWGCGNVFSANDLELRGVGQYGIRIHEPLSDCAGNPNVVFDNNTVTDPVVGVSNVPLTPAPE